MSQSHLSEEAFIALLEDNSSNLEQNTDRAHIETCDQCFLKFSQYILSYKNINSTILEKTPQSILMRVNQEFFINTSKNEEQESQELNVKTTNIPLDKLSHFKSNIFEYASIGIAAVVTIIFLGNYFRANESPPALDFKKINPSRFVIPAEKIANGGLQVSAINDTIWVKQPIKINRQMIIYDEGGKELNKIKFSDLSNIIVLPQGSGGEPHTIKIITRDSIVWQGEYIESLEQR
jgi:hypothetical protein